MRGCVNQHLLAIETRKELCQLRNESKSNEDHSVFQILIALAGFFALIDVCLQRKHFKGKKVKRHVLVPPTKEGAKEPGQGPGAAKPKEEPKPADKKAEKPKEADKGKDKGKGGKK